MDIITSLCITQSRKNDKKWVIATLLVALFCFAMTLCLRADRLFLWIHIPLLVIGSAALIKCCFNLRNFMYPRRGTLARSLRPYLEDWGTTDVLDLFSRIDKDMEEHGTQFDSVWVGREWVLGEEAMPIERIRGIFSFKTPTGSHPEWNICLVDDRRHVQITSLASERDMNKVYSHLTKLLPRAACGNFRDYMSFVGKTDEEMVLFNALFLSGDNDEKTEFVFRGSDGIPTSLITPDLIIETVDCLQPGQQVMLTPCIPLASPWGNSTSLACQRIDDDAFILIAYFKGRERDLYASPVCSRVKTLKALLDYFGTSQVPDPSGWEYLTPQVEQDVPKENYLLDVDDRTYEHITYDDVMASWEDLNEGKCRMILLHTLTCQSGYMQVSGSADNYTVEVVGLDSEDQICGYRTHTRYGGHVTQWLYDYYHEYKYPELRDDWDDITEELHKFIASRQKKKKW